MIIAVGGKTVALLFATNYNCAEVAAGEYLSIIPSPLSSELTCSIVVGGKSVSLLFATNFNTVGVASAASDLNLAYIAAGVKSVTLLFASKTLIIEHSGRC